MSSFTSQCYRPQTWQFYSFFPAFHFWYSQVTWPFSCIGFLGHTDGYHSRHCTISSFKSSYLCHSQVKKYNNLKNNNTQPTEVLLYTYYHPCTKCAKEFIPGIKDELEKAYGPNLQFTVAWSEEYGSDNQMNQAKVDLNNASISLIRHL